MSNRRSLPIGGSGLGRRTFLRRAGAAAALVGSPSLLASCATSGGGGGGDEGGGQVSGGGKSSDKNPFGVQEKAALEVVIFNGGFGDAYAKFHEKMYRQRYKLAESDLKHTATQEITKTMQPRFVSENPPDVLNNSGAQNIDTAALVKNQQLQNLTQLLEAPSYDDPNTLVKETIDEDATTNYIFNDKPYGLDYTLSINGMWYDAKLFADNDWEYPKNWDQLIDLGEKAKAKNLPLWIYQGQYPQYMLTVFDAMAQKAGGNEVLKKIDNLEDGAWQQDAVRQTLEALFELKQRKLIKPGTASLSHIEAQAAWLRGEALLIPCGSWLENEMKSQISDSFEMTVVPTPSISKDDALPFDAINYAPGEPFQVPADATNVAGGMEYLRTMLSKQGARKFAELTHTLTVVDGAHDNQDLGPVLESSRAAVDKAEKVERLDQVQYSTWYEPLFEDAKAAMGAMLTSNLDVDGFIRRVQKKADEVKKDPNINKQTR